MKLYQCHVNVGLRQRFLDAAYQIEPPQTLQEGKQVATLQEHTGIAPFQQASLGQLLGRTDAAAGGKRDLRREGLADLLVACNGMPS